MTEYKDINIDKLVKAKWNYKEDNDFFKRKLRANIEQHGQLENLIVREIGEAKYEVINGNHRLDVLREIGVNEITCCNIGKISDEKAKRIAIETNETRFPNNNEKLEQLLHDILNDNSLREMTQIKESLPFTNNYIDNLINSVNKDIKKIDKKIKPMFNKSEDTSNLPDAGMKNNQWFFIQFYNDKEKYERIKQCIKLDSKHEINSDWFFNKLYKE